MEKYQESTQTQNFDNHDQIFCPIVVPINYEKDISSKQLVIFIVSVVHNDFWSKELWLMSFLFTWNQSIVQQLISEGN